MSTYLCNFFVQGGSLAGGSLGGSLGGGSVPASPMALKTALSFGSPSNSKSAPTTSGLNLSSVLLQGAQGISLSCE